MSDCILFIARSFNIHRSGVTDSATRLLAWLVPRGTAAISAQILCTSFNHAPVYNVTSLKAT